MDWLVSWCVVFCLAGGCWRSMDLMEMNILKPKQKFLGGLVENQMIFRISIPGVIFSFRFPAVDFLGWRWWCSNLLRFHPLGKMEAMLTRICLNLGLESPGHTFFYPWLVGILKFQTRIAHVSTNTYYLDLSRTKFLLKISWCPKMLHVVTFPIHRYVDWYFGPDKKRPNPYQPERFGRCLERPKEAEVQVNLGKRQARVGRG